MGARLHVDQSVPAATSYRASRVKSLFNATDDQATRFTLDAELDIDLDNGDWSIGVIAGPSGSGKTSLGRQLWGGDKLYTGDGWPHDKPIVDGIAPDGSFDDVTAALAAAGLGDVPVWLRPYGVLSMGQRFRADLARVLAEKPDKVVFDEFTSVVDRQIAKIGAGAFAKAWRRTGGKAVLLTCHYDVLDWLEPDWVFDTATRSFQTKEYLQHRRPRFELEVRMGGWDLWPLFKAHHYLDLPHMVGAKCYVGFVDGEPVCHTAVGTQSMAVKRRGKTVHAVEARASRLVTMPEWQGAGVGMRFLNTVCQMQLDGEGVLPGRRMTTQFQTSHPQLAAGLRRSPKWRQVTAALNGVNRGASSKSLLKSGAVGGTSLTGNPTGYGGHLRAIQGFRYYGDMT
jgi:ABC-type transport system involved in cytochrome c biogenesis ATPase subunit/GNAT superfamily N-acetyltransferase